jgi:hypothetical protein
MGWTCTLYAELQNSKKSYGREIRWKTSGEATQEVDRCCAPGREGAAGCQKMEVGS